MKFATPPRALVLGLLFVAHSAGCGSNDSSVSPAQTQAIDELRKMGAVIELDGDVAVRMTWKSKQATDDALARVSDLPRLRYLNLSDSAVTDAGLHHLSSLQDLLFLDLSRTQVTDVGLSALRSLDHLQYLWLAETQVSAEAVSKLKSDLTGCTIQK